MRKTHSHTYTHTHTHTYIIIILSFHQHRYPYSSFATPPYCSLLLAGPQGYISYPYSAGRSAFAWPCEGVHRRTLLMRSSPLLQQFPASLLCLTLIVFMMGGRWPYSCCFVGCCLLDFIQNCSQHSCVVAVKLFLHPFSQCPCRTSIQQHRHDRCFEETTFYFIIQV